MTWGVRDVPDFFDLAFRVFAGDFLARAFFGLVGEDEEEETGVIFATISSISSSRLRLFFAGPEVEGFVGREGDEDDDEIALSVTNSSVSSSFRFRRVPFEGFVAGGRFCFAGLSPACSFAGIRQLRFGLVEICLDASILRIEKMSR